MSILPEDILIPILLRLTDKEISNMVMVNRETRKIHNKEYLWQSRTYNYCHSNEINKGRLSWKQFYISLKTGGDGQICHYNMYTHLLPGFPTLVTKALSSHRPIRKNIIPNPHNIKYRKICYSEPIITLLDNPGNLYIIRDNKSIIFDHMVTDINTMPNGIAILTTKGVVYHLRSSSTWIRFSTPENVPFSKIGQILYAGSDRELMNLITRQGDVYHLSVSQGCIKIYDYRSRGAVVSVAKNITGFWCVSESGELFLISPTGQIVPFNLPGQASSVTTNWSELYVALKNGEAYWISDNKFYRCPISNVKQVGCLFQSSFILTWDTKLFGGSKNDWTLIDTGVLTVDGRLDDIYSYIKIV